jgi:ubiquinone/menaquinone biosynthesis C-methylase UbiE
MAPGDSSTGYDPHEHWTNVGSQIKSRSRDRDEIKKVVAGDDVPFFRYKGKMFVDHFISKVPVTGRSILEFGCGPGGNLMQFGPKRPSRFAAVDISPTMLEVARENTASLPVPIEFHLIDGTKLPFSDGEFELSYTSTVLQHNPPEMFEAAVAELCRVTSEDLYFFEDTSESPWTAYSYYARTAQQYVDAASGAGGMHVVSIERLPVTVSYRVHEAIVRRFGHLEKLEGVPADPKQVRMEQLSLPFTRILDRFVTLRGGVSLTAIHMRKK